MWAWQDPRRSDGLHLGDSILMGYRSTAASGLDMPLVSHAPSWTAARRAFLRLPSCSTSGSTGEKPEQCTQCSSAFAHPSTLLQHMRTHTDERPHVCGVCGKSYFTMQQVHEHML